MKRGRRRSRWWNAPSEIGRASRNRTSRRLHFAATTAFSTLWEQLEQLGAIQLGRFEFVGGPLETARRWKGGGANQWDEPGGGAVDERRQWGRAGRLLFILLIRNDRYFARFFPFLFFSLLFFLSLYLAFPPLCAAFPPPPPPPPSFLGHNQPTPPPPFCLPFGGGSFAFSRKKKRRRKRRRRRRARGWPSGYDQGGVSLEAEKREREREKWDFFDSVCPRCRGMYSVSLISAVPPSDTTGTLRPFYFIFFLSDIKRFFSLAVQRSIRLFVCFFRWEFQKLGNGPFIFQRFNGKPGKTR